MFKTTIENILNEDSFTGPLFKGVFAFDEFSLPSKGPACMVVNNKPLSHTGEHWLAIHYDQQGRSSFFDSYGMSPQFYKFPRFSNWNQRRVQGSSEYCGLYCVLYLLLKCRKRENDFFKMFTTDLLKNDNFILTELKTRNIKQ
jgi:hypothetical protein